MPPGAAPPVWCALPSSEQYYTLMASLPALHPPYTQERTPLGRIGLERRLAMLEPAHAQELDALESIVHFDRLDWDLSEAEAVAHAEAVLGSIRSTVLAEVARWRLGIRTVIAALQRRQAGRPAPGRREPWGAGPWMHTLRNNWNVRDFGLSAVLPWIEDFGGLLERGESHRLERRLLGEVWTHLSRQAAPHHFNFEAVALYVLRWNVVHRATHQDGKRARLRFDRLVEESMRGVSLGFEVPSNGRETARITHTDAGAAFPEEGSS